ncbi:MAG: DUF1127 domain-containing protein [Pseudomonadota bacterium]
MTQATSIAARVSAFPGFTPIKHLIRLAFQVRRERLDLGRLTPEQLRDIGLMPDQAEHETGRAFWDLPASRR